MLIYDNLCVRGMVYVNEDSSNIGFPHINFLRGPQSQKNILCIVVWEDATVNPLPHTALPPLEYHTTGIVNIAAKLAQLPKLPK